MGQDLEPVAFSGAAALLAAAIMVVLGVLGNLGIYTGLASAMQQWHMFFDLTPVGIVAGAVEAAVLTFLMCYPFVVLYNRLLER